MIDRDKMTDEIQVQIHNLIRQHHQQCLGREIKSLSNICPDDTDDDEETTTHHFSIFFFQLSYV